MGDYRGSLSRVDWSDREAVLALAKQLSRGPRSSLFVSTGPRGYVIGFVSRLNEPGYLRGTIVWRSDVETV